MSSAEIIDQTEPPRTGPNRAQSPRISFMRGEGFILYTDVNARFLEALGMTAIRPLKSRDIDYGVEGALKDANTRSHAALYEVTGLLSESVPGHTNGSFYRQFGVRANDRDAALGFAMAAGFGDMSFPWHFSAGLASSAVHSFVENGKITAEQAGDLTLGDWANVIGSGWFSKLAHSCAFTGNGYWANFGSQRSHYDSGALQEHLNGRLNVLGGDKVTELFDVKEEPEPLEDLVYFTASLRPEIRGRLRKKMLEDTQRPSTGCPVARRVARLPAVKADANAHIQNLKDSGVLTERPIAGSNKVLIEQEYTAIDRTLAFIADQLDRYEQLYGNPVSVSNDFRRAKVEHEFRSPTNALRHRL